MRFLSMLVSLAFFGAFFAMIGLFLIVMHYSVGLPDYHQLAVYQPQVTSRVYASDGSLVAEYATEKRSFVPVENIPEMLKNAFIAAEDKNFYNHGGIDFFGLTRAVITNIKNFGTGRRAIGASTITQQVAKNFLLTSERSLSRKIKEALLARKMEDAFTKNHILELYLNEIYLGIGSYGVASAALNYFDKSMEELTIDEMAFLAALPKAPNNYHPIRRAKAAKERRDWVLWRMYKDGYITLPQMAKAISVPVHMVDRSADLAEDAGYYAEEVRRFVSARYGDEAIYNGGLFIRTSLDPELQKLAVHSLQNGLLKYDKRHGWRGPLAHYETIDAAKAALTTWPDLPYLPKGWSVAVVTALTPDAAEIVLKDGQTGKIPIKALSWAQKALEGGRIDKAKVTKPADVLAVGDLVYVSQTTSAEVFDLQQMPQAEGALVALDPHTGRVLALSGGFSFQKNQFNRAVQAFRQPGSSFKPFVYLAALDSGYTPSSLILDAPLVMEQPDGTKWKPKNYSKIFYGPTTLRVGIEKSRNLMTIRLARAIGMRKVLAYAEKFGISDKLEPVLATALGAGETTLIKLTAAYGMLVNGGREITPNFIDRIQDRDGRTIYKHDRRACYNCSGDTASGDVLPSVPDPRPQIQDPVSAYQMVNILSGVVERGTGRSVKSLGKTLGAKSGTSNDSFDAWFIGFSPDLVVGVWVGFDQPQTLGPNDTGGVVAAPIFKEFMAEALKDKSDIPFRIPPGVRLVRVDATTGKPAQSGNKNIIQEAFRLDTDLSRPTKIVGEDITIKTDEEEAPDIGGVY